MKDDSVTLPPDDRCDFRLPYRCEKTKAEHSVRHINGGPGHVFVAPEGAPRPEHVTSCHIQTDWTCTHCGADNDVWGEAHDWMECGYCGGESFLVPFLTESEPNPASVA